MTRVYGRSDDLVEFEGELRGEIGCYGSGDDGKLGVLVAFSDGTILAVRYGKPVGEGIWAIDVLRQGELFDRLEVCTDAEADPYSDQVFFKDGKLKAWNGLSAEAVR
jgi:hypothetical protein